MRGRRMELGMCAPLVELEMWVEAVKTMMEALAEVWALALTVVEVWVLEM